MFALFTVNRLFKKGKEDEIIPGPCYDGKSTFKYYNSVAEVYEARNANNLSKKFPFLSRFGQRVRMVISEIGIMGLIICQTLILVF